MLHLMIEVELCGLVHTPWKYPMERHMKSLKTYVCNMARSMGSIEKKYIMEELIGFCT